MRFRNRPIGLAALPGMATVLAVAACSPPQSHGGGDGAAQRRSGAARREAKEIARLQASASPRHAWRAHSEVAGGWLQLREPLRARAGVGKLLVGARASFDLAIDAWGCASPLEQLAPVAPALATDSPFRIEYDHPGQGLLEAYVSGPLGIEQVVRVSRLPACAIAGAPLSLRIRSSPDWRAVLRDGVVELGEPSGRTLFLGHAFAEDAIGRELSTGLRVVDGEVRIEVAVGGAVLPIHIDPLLWERAQTRTVNAPGAAGDGFGASVALSDDTVLTAASGASVVGKVYAYERANLLAEPQVLVDPSSMTGGAFGRALAIDGNVAVVGAPNEVAIKAPGRAYLLTRSSADARWSIVEPALTAGRASAAADRFGSAVAVSGDLIIVGGPGVTSGEPSARGAGAVFAFRYKAGEVRSLGQLPFPHECARPHGATDGFAGYGFGSSLSLNGTTALVGAPGSAACSGSAYLYEAEDGVFGSGVALLPTATGALGENDRFGEVVGLSASLAVIGAPYWRATDDAKEPVGAVFAFEPSHGEAFAPLRPVRGTSFGLTVAVSSGVLAVGQAFPELVTDTSIYLYDPQSFDLQQLRAMGDETYTFWGSSLAASGRAVLVGSKNDRGLGKLQLLLLAAGSSCSASAECDSGYCVNGLCCASACDGVCEACSAALTGGEDGTCAFSKSGTSCGRATCSVDATEQYTFACNSGGACERRQLTCSPGRCLDSKCDLACTRSADCGAQGYCDGARCQGRRPLAMVCERGDQCASGACTDGVCCTEACGGQCEACDVADRIGTCVAVTGGPHGQRPECGSGSAVCSRRTCDGIARDSCAAFVGAEVLCDGPPCAGHAEIAAACRNGECLAPACDASCQSDYDCAAGLECGRAGECVMREPSSRRRLAACSLAAATPAAPSGPALCSFLVVVASLQRARSRARARNRKKERNI